MAELDKIRTELLNRSAVILQRHARGFVARSKYQRQRQAVVTLQVSPRALQPHFLWHSHHAPSPLLDMTPVLLVIAMCLLAITLLV
jgi:myosin heavy subunit